MMGLYSIRMRGAEGGPHEEGGRHISGAERIVEESDLESVASSLIHRAMHHSKGKSDFITRFTMRILHMLIVLMLMNMRLHR